MSSPLGSLIKSSSCVSFSSHRCGDSRQSPQGPKFRSLSAFAVNLNPPSSSSSSSNNSPRTTPRASLSPPAPAYRFSRTVSFSTIIEESTHPVEESTYPAQTPNKTYKVYCNRADDSVEKVSTIYYGLHPAVYTAYPEDYKKVNYADYKTHLDSILQSSDLHQNAEEFYDALRKEQEFIKKLPQGMQDHFTYYTLGNAQIFRLENRYDDPTKITNSAGEECTLQSVNRLTVDEVYKEEQAFATKSLNDLHHNPAHYFNVNANPYLLKNPGHEVKLTRIVGQDEGRNPVILYGEPTNILEGRATRLQMEPFYVAREYNKANPHDPIGPGHLFKAYELNFKCGPNENTFAVEICNGGSLAAVSVLSVEIQADGDVRASAVFKNAPQLSQNTRDWKGFRDTTSESEASDAEEAPSQSFKKSRMSLRERVRKLRTRKSRNQTRAAWLKNLPRLTLSEDLFASELRAQCKPWQPSAPVELKVERAEYV